MEPLCRAEYIYMYIYSPVENVLTLRDLQKVFSHVEH